MTTRELSKMADEAARILMAVDPALLLPGGAIVLVLLLATGIFFWQRSASTRAVRKRSTRVRVLAKRGASHGDIARSTGLSRDAVALLVNASVADAGRRNLPTAAAFAALRRPGLRTTLGVAGS